MMFFEGMTVGGDFTPPNGLTELSRNFTVGGVLDIRHTNVTHIPEGVTAGTLRASGSCLRTIDPSARFRRIELTGGLVKDIPAEVLQHCEELVVNGSLLTKLADGMSPKVLNIASTCVDALPEDINLSLCRELKLLNSNVTRIPDAARLGQAHVAQAEAECAVNLANQQRHGGPAPCLDSIENRGTIDPAGRHRE